MAEPRILETTRLQLIQMTLEEQGLLFELDQDEAVMRFINGGHKTTMEQIEQYFMPRLKRYHNPLKGYGLWKVYAKTAQELPECLWGQYLGWILVRPMFFFTDTPHFDDIELVDWTTTNFLFARLWFCEDIHHSSILKLAIKKAIQKSTNWIFSSKLFEDDSNDEKNQFVGFVSSHKKGTLLTSFHIHSFVVLHTDLQKNTIVTYTLTSQNHMMSNMQD